MLLGEEDSPTLFDQVDSVDPNRETGETSQRRGWRGVSDVSDTSEAPNGVSGMFEKRERGGYLETIEDEHAHNVVELRRYQQEEDAWNDEDREELVQGDVYVIDDADRFLKEESSEREAGHISVVHTSANAGGERSVHAGGGGGEEAEATTAEEEGLCGAKQGVDPDHAGHRRAGGYGGG